MGVDTTRSHIGTVSSPDQKWQYPALISQLPPWALGSSAESLPVSGQSETPTPGEIWE